MWLNLSITYTFKVGIGFPIFGSLESRSFSLNSLNVTCTVVSVIPYIFINLVWLYLSFHGFIRFGFSASPPNIIYLMQSLSSSFNNSLSSKL